MDMEIAAGRRTSDSFGDSSGDRIEQCARALMARFGEEAKVEALLRADAARQYQDRLGVDVWQRVAAAITRLKAA